jgi:hypothetical protein
MPELDKADPNAEKATAFLRSLTALDLFLSLIMTFMHNSKRQ